MDQERLFRLAPEAMHVTAHYVAGEGWTVAVNVRRGDETWHDTRPETYSCLTTPELLDVVESVLPRRLGL